MTTAIDTNMMLDLLIPNTRFLVSSQKALETAHTEGSLILCEAVYAELASQFDAEDEIGKFLSTTGILLVPANSESLAATSARDQIFYPFAWPSRFLCNGNHQSLFVHPYPLIQSPGTWGQMAETMIKAKCDDIPSVPSPASEKGILP